RARQAQDPRLRNLVADADAVAGDRRGRSDEDHAPAAGLGHRREDCLGDVRGPEEVHIERPTELRGSQIREFLVPFLDPERMPREAGRDVDAPERREGLRGEGTAGTWIRHLALDRGRLPPEALHLLDDRLGGILAAAVLYHEVGTLAGQVQGHGPAEPSASAGDDRDAALQSAHGHRTRAACNKSSRARGLPAKDGWNWSACEGPWRVRWGRRTAVASPARESCNQSAPSGSGLEGRPADGNSGSGNGRNSARTCCRSKSSRAPHAAASSCACRPPAPRSINYGRPDGPRAGVAKLGQRRRT